MRGADVTQEGLFVVRKTADYVPAGHPLVAIRDILNRALREMDLLFESLYEDRGRDSVPPEWLLRGLVLQALHGIRSERLLCEQLNTTDPDARLATKSNKAEAIPAFMGHVLMENRGKLAIDTRLTLASGTAEREAAIEMLGSLPGDGRKTIGADKNYDTAGFVEACREIKVTPQVARNTYEFTTKTGKRVKRDSAIDERTTRHAGYKVSQVIRKIIETIFGDGKQHGTTIRQFKQRGQAELLTTVWPHVEKHVIDGAMVTITERSIRVRGLPVSGKRIEQS